MAGISRSRVKSGLTSSADRLNSKEFSRPSGCEHKVIPAAFGGAILSSSEAGVRIMQLAERRVGRSGTAGIGRHHHKPGRIRTAPALKIPSGVANYDRKRELPGLLALWPWEIEDTSLEGHQRLVDLLRRALRRERQRGISGHWTYDVARHARLLAAYKCEAAALKARLARANAKARSL